MQTTDLVIYLIILSMNLNDLHKHLFYWPQKGILFGLNLIWITLQDSLIGSSNIILL